MKNKVFYLMVFFSATLWLTCCCKEKPEPQPEDPCPWPEITTEGLNTLGFKINGKEWVPCVDLYGLVVGLTPIEASLTESDGTNALSVVGTYSYISKGDSTISGFGLSLRPVNSGIVSINNLANCNFTFSQHGNGIFHNEWSLPNSREGFHLDILKLDTSKNIISGLFEAILLPKYGTDTLRISDGRFDLNYYPQ